MTDPEKMDRASSSMKANLKVRLTRLRLANAAIKPSNGFNQTFSQYNPPEKRS